MYKNYIFDLYGTLVNIRTDEWSKNFYKKFAKWLRKEGYSFEWKKFQKSFQETEQKYHSRIIFSCRCVLCKDINHAPQTAYRWQRYFLITLQF